MRAEYEYFPNTRYKVETTLNHFFQPASQQDFSDGTFLVKHKMLFDAILKV
jgi:hypothetical protein